MVQAGITQGAQHLLGKVLPTQPAITSHGLACTY
jgi:hypothetical protein